MRLRLLPPTSRLVLALLSLVAWAASAEEPPAPTLRTRNVELTGKAEPVRVSTRIPTTLTFDTRLDVQAVKPDKDAPIELLAVGARSLTVRALEELSEAVMLRVPLLDAPTAAVFKLTPAEDIVDAQVLVFRDAQAPELIRARVAELEARSAACEAALAAERRRGTDMSPARWVLSGQMGRQGVRFSLLPGRRIHGTDGMRVTPSGRFETDAWVVLTVEVKNNLGAPWRPGAAWLEEPATGHRVAARGVAMVPGVLPLKGTGAVAVEFGPMPGSGDVPGARFRLVIEEAGGTRTLSIPDLALGKPSPMPEKGGP